MGQTLTFNHGCATSSGVAQSPGKVLKTIVLVKGQLLGLCLTGQGLAVVEQLEEEKKSQQKFPDLKKRLDDVFQTSADMETKMAEFEQRISL